MKLNKKELEEVIVNTKINLQKARIASDYKIRKNSWTYENRKEIKERVIFLEGILTKLKKTGDE